MLQMVEAGQPVAVAAHFKQQTHVARHVTECARQGP